MLTFHPWPDEHDAARHRSDSPYVETFWLSALGPTATLLLRFASRAAADGPTTVSPEDVGRRLGVSPALSPNKPLGRALHRLERSGAALSLPGEGSWAVRLTMPFLPLHLARRLPPSLQAQHAALRRFVSDVGAA